MSDRSTHRHGGRRPGAGRPPKPPADRQQGKVVWVPIEDAQDEALLADLAPPERAARLLRWPARATLIATGPEGAIIEFAWDDQEVYGRGAHPAGMTPAQQAAVGAVFALLQPDAEGTIHLDLVIARLEAAGYSVAAIEL